MRCFPVGHGILMALALLAATGGAGAQEVTHVAAREITVYNDLRAALAVAPTDTVAREITAYNDLRILLVVPYSDASARELTAYNDLRAILAVTYSDAVAREFSIGQATDPMAEVRLLLRFVGGLSSATAADRTKYDLVAGTSAGKLDILDAIRLARKVTGLDP